MSDADIDYQPDTSAHWPAVSGKAIDNGNIDFDKEIHIGADTDECIGLLHTYFFILDLLIEIKLFSVKYYYHYFGGLSQLLK